MGGAVTAARADDLLDAAAHIGAALCRDAHWHDGACNWMGHPSSEALDPSAPATPTLAALPADIYGGSAGVGLFLAQLHRVRPEASLAATAAGAARQALARAADHEGLPPLGFYTGRLGIAWAAARIGSWIGDGSLAGRGLALARELAATPATPLVELLGGSAGAILGLLAVAGAARDLHAAAERLGDEIVARASRSDDAWSWDATGASAAGIGPRLLTGLSHGAAGIGVALAALHVRTGRPVFRDAAAGAFAYEDGLYDVTRENWQDLRATRASTSTAPGFAIAWCHGAPGIGLARLRAAAWVPELAARSTGAIAAALRTTRSRLGLHARDHGLDATPCHGLGGLSELLVANGAEGDVALARRVWRGQIRAHRRTESWPSGVATRAPNPSLFLGSAGVGHALLRLRDPSIESFLLVAPAQ